MELQSVKELLESGEVLPSSFDVLPGRFYNTLILNDIRVDFAERGHLIGSMKIPPRLVNNRNILHGGVATSLIDVMGASVIATVVGSAGVTLDLNISYFDLAFLGEEIEIEGKVLHIGKAIGVSNVELRKKSTGNLVAYARQTAYLAGYSKL